MGNLIFGGPNPWDQFIVVYTLGRMALAPLSTRHYDIQPYRPKHGLCRSKVTNLIGYNLLCVKGVG